MLNYCLHYLTRLFVLCFQLTYYSSILTLYLHYSLTFLLCSLSHFSHPPISPAFIAHSYSRVRVPFFFTIIDLFESLMKAIDEPQPIFLMNIIEYIKNEK